MTVGAEDVCVPRYFEEEDKQPQGDNIYIKEKRIGYMDFLKTTGVGVATFLLGLCMTGCDMMTTDMDDCPTGLYVSFKYDYNIPRSDMFRDHVGSVTLYVFDADGKFVRSYTEENNAAADYFPLTDYAYRMHITDLPDGEYKFVALANQKRYADTQTGRGAKYRRTSLSVGDDMERLSVKLDRMAGTRTVSTDHIPFVDNEGMPLDTLWHGMDLSPISVMSDEPTYETISLVRDTKMLTVSLHQIDSPADIDIEDYEMYIVDNNGWLSFDNSLHTDEDILYTPYNIWNTEFTNDDGTEVLQRTAHATLMFNRLMYYDEADKNAVLVVRNKKTDKEVAAINLSDCLAQGRNADERWRYSRQEFLDREYNYKLDFFLKGDEWRYVDVSISVLSWSKRIQREVL
ncbi:MAG: FimB/Mfa2 family fimbrial subunit [Bacteroides sp.]|nr:FimB/Mfa2 family fimbrial subunit [Roseburia sp.]MCM1347106.1 FimB/Mfa2 family fimbrial subunit [Bacteroides sp.]MCM1420710.1 FimB/Mfa2 family fimbrial subunit [Bacteroides sp.]